MIELYAITDRTAPPLPEGRRLRALPAGALAVVVGDPPAGGELSAESAWEREQLIEDLMADRDVLPVRFGTRFASADAAASAVAERAASLREALERVRGAAELAVRVLVARPEPVLRAATNGAEYLRLRAHAEAERARARRAIHEPLAAQARDVAERPPQPPQEVLRAAYLVDRAQVEDFSRAVARLQSEHGDLRILCTGPWPPFSFADS